MSISDAAINALPLGKDVFDDLTYCLQEWQTAGSGAVMELPDPEDPNSTFDWVISLIGNLTWAATVFFPPAFAIAAPARVAIYVGEVAGSANRVYASASAATQAASMLGATLASGVVPKLRQLEGNLRSPQGKRFLDDYMGSQVPAVQHAYAVVADPWVKKDLINHLISQYSLRSHHPNPKQNLDAAFTEFYNSAEGAEERRRYVWNDFVFPRYDTTFDNGPSFPGGRVGLKNVLVRQLSDALEDFDRQWHAYRKAYDRADPRKNFRTIYGPPSGDFKPPDLPPFSPHLKFKGVPPKVQFQQEQKQFMLKWMLGS
jgi:hypothetical protein